MPTVYIDDKSIELAPGEKLNCIQAAERAGIEIPSYCYHPARSVVASCRMCLVEVGE
jgi:NADH-quinone oxidoreductase subunit G